MLLAPCRFQVCEEPTCGVWREWVPVFGSPKWVGDLFSGMFEHVWVCFSRLTVVRQMRVPNLSIIRHPPVLQAEGRGPEPRGRPALFLSCLSGRPPGVGYSGKGRGKADGALGSCSDSVAGAARVWPETADEEGGSQVLTAKWTRGQKRTGGLIPGCSRE